MNSISKENRKSKKKKKSMHQKTDLQHTERKNKIARSKKAVTTTE